MLDTKKLTTYTNRSEVAETFVDHVEAVTMFENIFRMELSVTRFDTPTPPAPPKGQRYPACRLVMPLSLALELHGKLEGVVRTLEQQGVIKREPQDSSLTQGSSTIQ